MKLDDDAQLIVPECSFSLDTLVKQMKLNGFWKSLSSLGSSTTMRLDDSDFRLKSYFKNGQEYHGFYLATENDKLSVHSEIDRALDLFRDTLPNRVMPYWKLIMTPVHYTNSKRYADGSHVADVAFRLSMDGPVSRETHDLIDELRGPFTPEKMKLFFEIMYIALDDEVRSAHLDVCRDAFTRMISDKSYKFPQDIMTIEFEGAPARIKNACKGAFMFYPHAIRIYQRPDEDVTIPIRQIFPL